MQCCMYATPLCYLGQYVLFLDESNNCKLHQIYKVIIFIILISIIKLICIIVFIMHNMYY